MGWWAPLSDAGAWLTAMSAIAGTALAAGALLLRDRFKLEGRTKALESENERLQDTIWKLSESEERYRGLVEAQLDIIVQRDGEGQITFANDGYANLTGQPRERLLGSKTGPKVVEAGQVHMRSDGARLIDEAIETKTGLRWIAWIETTVLGRNGRAETLRLGRDVTDRVVSERALEEARAKAEAANDAKSRFLATFSHEFRTPLNGILGMADLLVDTGLTAEQATYVQAIKSSGEAFLSLIDEILDFSKIEAGRIDLSAEPFDLPALVEGVVELLAPRAQGKGIEISAFVAPGVPRQVVGDADRLRQILVNLAGNAVKFTESGGVGVTVESVGTAEILIAVRDTGPGIAPERLVPIFEEFEQGDSSLSRRHEGTGLGLAITRRLVERMQGSITVESEIGCGARFLVRLPLPGPVGDAPVPEPAQLQGRRILMLARSPFEGPFLARRLEEHGATVTQVESPAEALAAIATSPWDIVFADYALGDDAVREVARKARAAGVERTVVLLSPFERRDFGSPNAAGFDTYLVKPVRPRSLIERLTKAMPAPATAEIVRQRRSGSPINGRATARVLLAEDNEINALLALRSLEKLGALVDWAKNGDEALALAEASFAGSRPEYDLILMDIRMPGLDGHEATRRIRAVERTLGRGRRSRIIALTANASREDEHAAERAGLDGFLAKPFEFQALRAILLDANLAQAS
jgi:PAS domain S-box-containing protein